MSNGHPKRTLVPLSHARWDLQQHLPIRVSEEAEAEHVQGLLKTEHFDLWKDYVAKRDSQVFVSARTALVHQYQGSEHGTGKQDTASQDHLYKLFLLLRLVKPTGTRFAAVHVRVLDASELEVFSFTHPSSAPLNVPNSERPNAVTAPDLNRVAELSRRFLTLVGSGPENLRRAVRFYEEAYSDIWDPILQLITWVTGIESACIREDGVASTDEILRRVSELVPFSQDIYEDSSFKQEPLRGYSNLPEFRVGDAIGDLFELRNRFIHGLWIPRRWAERVMYQAVGGPAVVYADALREAAAYILRQLLLRRVQGWDSSKA